MILSHASEIRMGNDLIDALDKKITGDEQGAAELVIPWAKRDPVLVTSFLLSLLHGAVGAHARATGRQPHDIFHENWSKP